MKLPSNRVFIGYYLTIMLSSIYWLSITLFQGMVGFEEAYSSFLTSGQSLLSIILTILNLLVFLTSLVLLSMSIYHKWSIQYLVVPTYYIFYYFVWGYIVSLVAGYLFLPNDPVIIIDILSGYDPIFHVINIILPGVFLYKLLKIK